MIRLPGSRPASINTFPVCSLIAACLLGLLGCQDQNDEGAGLVRYWSRDLVGDEPPLTRPLRVGDSLFVCYRNGQLHCLDPETGNRLGLVHLGLNTAVHSPELPYSDGLLFVLGAYGCCAVERETLGIRWTWTTSRNLETTCLGLEGTRLALGGIGGLTVLDSQTGAVVHELPVYNTTTVASVVIDGDLLYYNRWQRDSTTVTSTVSAYNMATRTTAWSRQFQFESLQSRMVNRGGHLFLNGLRTSYALDCADGALLAEWDTRAGYSFGSAPEVADHEVLFAGGTAFWAIDAVGLQERILPSGQLGSRFGFSIGPDRRLATVDKGNLALVDLDGAGPIARITLEGERHGSPLYDGSRIYLVTAQGLACYTLDP